MAGAKGSQGWGELGAGEVAPSFCGCPQLSVAVPGAWAYLPKPYSGARVSEHISCYSNVSVLGGQSTLDGAQDRQGESEALLSAPCWWGMDLLLHTACL